METKYLYKTTPNYFFIFIMLIGVVAPAYFADMIWSSNALRSGHTVIVIIFLAFFLAFSLLCLGLIVASKVIYLTSDHLIIAMPLLFYKRFIMYNEIKSMPEKEEKIDLSNRVFWRDIVSIGHNTTLQLADGKTTGISSIQVWGYNELIKTLHTQVRIHNSQAHH